jgi:hypothetical protein
VCATHIWAPHTHTRFVVRRGVRRAAESAIKPLTRDTSPPSAVANGAVPPGGNPLSVIDALAQCNMLSSPIGAFDDVDSEEYDGGYSHWPSVTQTLGSPICSLAYEDDGASVFPPHERMSPVSQVLDVAPPITPVSQTLAQSTDASDGTSVKSGIGLGDVSPKETPPPVSPKSDDDLTVLDESPDPAVTRGEQDAVAPANGAEVKEGATNDAPPPPLIATDAVDFTFARAAAHVGTSIFLAAVIGFLILLLGELTGGHAALPLVLNTVTLIACQGGTGLARSIGLSTSACEGAPLFSEVALKIILGLFATLFLVIQLSESFLVPMANAALYRGGQMLVRGLRGVLRPQAHVRGVRGLFGTICALLLFMLYIQGGSAIAVGKPSPMKAGTIYAQTVTIARNGSQLIEGSTGVAVRKALDSLSCSLLDNVSMPVMINAGADSLDLAYFQHTKERGPQLLFASRRQLRLYRSSRGLDSQSLAEFGSLGLWVDG